MPRQSLKRFTELHQFDLDPESIQMLPLPFCTRNQIVVLGKVDVGATEPIHVGMLEIQRHQLVRALSIRWGRPVIPVELNQYEINKALDAGFGTGLVAGDADGHLLLMGQDLPNSESSAVELVDDMLLHAVSKNASDIHLETYLGDIDVRLRIDGIMHQLLTHIDPANVNEVVNRIKVLSRLDVVENRHPQDGRFRARILDGDRQYAVDFRVSTLPGLYGEDIVLRVLNPETRQIGIDKLGMNASDLDIFHNVLSNPEGCILVTGPTGSGKTTTLYAALAELQDGSKKILTAEDPVEIYLPKVNQKQATPTLSMADLARAFLRQDPDVLLIGEIRDYETADVMARAAVTGHLVLGTLHTYDAVGAVPRLRQLDLDDHEVADTLLLVISQRLAQRICPDCAEDAPLTDEQRSLLGDHADGLEPRRGRGCESCYETGGRGRIGIFELLVFDGELQGMVAAGRSTQEIRKAATERGLRTLLDDAVEKVRAGVISLDELFRVIPYRQLTGG